MGYNRLGFPRRGEEDKQRNRGEVCQQKLGDVAPDFKLPSVSEGDFTLSQFKGEKSVILSFHVFDFTSG